MRRFQGHWSYAAICTLILLAFTMAGCGGGGGSASTSPGASSGSSLQPSGSNPDQPTPPPSNGNTSGAQPPSGNTNGTQPPAAGGSGGTQTASMGPLKVCASNPRYFCDPQGNPVYLTGSHTWSDLKEVDSTTNPPAPFDYTAWLDFLQAHNHNFMRGWTWELSKYTYDGTMNYSSPFPWPRTGPGTALDGQPKFDLSQFNQAYFDRIRNEVIEAGQRGIYVSIMLFEGHGVQESLAPWCWNGHPFNINNNINGINGDPNGDGRGTEIDTLQIPAVTAIQEAYVKKMIDTLNDLDNVLWEVANEAGSYSTQWQYHMINFIKSYEATKPKQHPVGMTFQYAGGSTSTLFASPADWISPGTDMPYQTNPPAADGSKVVIVDTDHLGGAWGDRTWIWKCFARGLNPIVMDPYLEGGGNEGERVAMGETLTYAKKMDLGSDVPRGDLSSTGYALANPGKEYLVYQPGSGSSFSVSLAAGTYSYEWFNTATNSVAATGTVTSNGGSLSFTPPFSTDAVLYLHQ